MNFLDKVGSNEYNRLYHFGDSFGCWAEGTKGFSKYIADYFKLGWSHHAVRGISNFEICKIILKNLHRFREGDLLLINWSLWERISYLSDNLELNNTNVISSGKMDKRKPFNEKYKEYLINHKLNYAAIESLHFFLHIIIPLIQTIERMGIKVINSFNTYNIHFTSYIKNDFVFNKPGFIKYNDILIKEIDVIEWSNEAMPDYLTFLHENDYFKEGEDVHYKFGIQEELANHWIDKIKTQILNE